MKNQNHIQEIIDTRMGGFGGSDAAMVMEVADRLQNNMELSTTQRHRMLQLLGDETPGVFSTPETEAGHAFENEMAESMPKEWRREEMLRDSDPSRYENFSVFAHADFYEPVTASVKECKWSRKYNLEGLKMRYKWQLQWYYMLGVKSVSLAYDTEEGRGCVDVPRDEEAVTQLRSALRMIDDRWHTMDFTIHELRDTEVAPGIREALVELKDLEAQKSVIAAKIDELRARIGKYMEETESTKISGSYGFVSYVAPSESVQFDSRKFAQDHADLYAAYRTKLVKKAGYITCKFTNL